MRAAIRKRLRAAKVDAGRLYQRDDEGRLVVLPNAPRESSGSNLLWGWELARELRRRRWRVTVLPPEFDVDERRRFLRREMADAILMIKGRHPLHQPAFYRPTPCVFILDDADYVLPEEVDQVVSCCRDARAVIAGNRRVADWCRQHNDNVSVVWVSHPVPRRRAPFSNERRAPIVAWAHAAPWRYPIEAEFVRRVLLEVARRRPFEFRLHGVRHPGEWDDWLRPLRAAGVTIRTLPFESSYARYLASLGDVAVGLHPVCLENRFSEGKSFGKALSYIAADVAVVTHDVLDHADFFAHERNAMLASDVAGYAAAVERLLAEPDFRHTLTRRCFDDFAARLSTPVAASRVEAIVRSLR